MNAILQTAFPHTVIQKYISRRKNGPRAVALRDAAKSAEQAASAYPEIQIQEPATNADSLSRDYCGFYREASSHEEKVAMYTRAAGLPHLLVTWILIADNQKAQLYECSKPMQPKKEEAGKQYYYYDERSGQTLAPVPHGFIEAESIPNGRMKRPGDATDSNADLFHNAYELRRFIQAELHRQFLRAIASKLQQAYEVHSFDRLVLAMPSGMVSELKKRLTYDVQDCIIVPSGRTGGQ